MTHAAAEWESWGVSSRWSRPVEAWLERQREQLPLGIPVAIGAGIAAWFIAGPSSAPGLAMVAAALVLTGIAVGLRHRLGVVLSGAGLAFLLGLGTISWRAERVAGPVLAKPWTGGIAGRVVETKTIDARDVLRLTVAVSQPREVPHRVRVNVPLEQARPAMRRGAEVSMRVRLMPPAPPAVPGGYDFARRAWFERIGATGRLLGPITVAPGPVPPESLRARLARRVATAVDGRPAGIAVALATGDTGRVRTEDAEAMRASGMAHLLAISGLHVGAVAGAAFLLVSRLLALFPAIALRARVPLLAAGASAAAAIGYTLLAGAEIPTIRSCVAALLVLGALALGREPLTLRLVAAGAMVILLLWPESLVGPSFQLSFAAVITIVALHESRWMRRLLERRDEGWPARVGRGLLGLLITGIAVELALMPIALYHFHRAGLYGALANVVAIPLTTFVIMPLEALAILSDWTGLAAPLWWLTGRAIAVLLALAHQVSSWPGAQAVLPGQSRLAFGLVVAAGLWVALIRGRERWAAMPVGLLGAVLIAASPRPDVLITGDGRHLLLVGEDGTAAMLRERSGDYVRSTLGEAAGLSSQASTFEAIPGARCTVDMCSVRVKQGERSMVLLATRSSYPVPWRPLVQACGQADLVVSERRLPDACRPRWLKADRDLLERSGGLAIRIGPGEVRSVADELAGMPWWPARVESHVQLRPARAEQVR